MCAILFLTGRTTRQHVLPAVQGERRAKRMLSDVGLEGPSGYITMNFNFRSLWNLDFLTGTAPLICPARPLRHDAT